MRWLAQLEGGTTPRLLVLDKSGTWMTTHPPLDHLTLSADEDGVGSLVRLGAQCNLGHVHDLVALHVSIHGRDDLHLLAWYGQRGGRWAGAETTSPRGRLLCLRAITPPTTPVGMRADGRLPYVMQPQKYLQESPRRRICTRAPPWPFALGCLVGKIPTAMCVVLPCRTAWRRNLYMQI